MLFNYFMSFLAIQDGVLTGYIQIQTYVSMLGAVVVSVGMHLLHEQLVFRYHRLAFTLLLLFTRSLFCFLPSFLPSSNQPYIYSFMHPFT